MRFKSTISNTNGSRAGTVILERGWINQNLYRPFLYRTIYRQRPYRWFGRRIWLRLWQDFEPSLGKWFHHLLGFDFAPKMLERGRATHPHLRLYQIEKSGRIPLADQSVNAIILSTVLCCNPSLEEQSKITSEIERLLTKGGILYLYDFLITRTEKNLHRYAQHAQPGDENYGVYQTPEGIFVRHHSLWWILDLLQQFNILWLEQINHVTVNNNPVRTVHLIAQKP